MSPQQVLVVGNGMVGQRFVDRLLGAQADTEYEVTVIGDEPRLAYDRVALSTLFDGASEADLALVDPAIGDHPRVNYRLGRTVTVIDVARHRVVLDDGEVLLYDEAVLATGSRPFVPPIPNHDADGCFVYRTIDDLARIEAWARSEGCRVGAVIGGGLLGLEAAAALQHLGLDVHVVEMAAHPMPQQLDPGSGAMLARWIESRGIKLHCDVRTESILTGDHSSIHSPTVGTAAANDAGSGADGVVTGLRFGGDAPYDLACDIVVFSAGIRPRDELARASGLAVGERGGIIVDDTLRTSDPAISAIGEVACHNGRVYGLVAPGYEMAGALAARLTGDQEARFVGSDQSAKLKLLGVEVASFTGSRSADDVEELVYSDPTAKIHRRLLIDSRSGELVSGCLVGDSSGYDRLRAIALGTIPADQVGEGDLAAAVLPAGLANVEASGNSGLPDDVNVCTCNAVTAGQIRECVIGGCHSVPSVAAETSAGTSCGGCLPTVTALLNETLRAEGVEVTDRLCSHFDHSRQELFDLIRFHRYTTWTEVLTAHGSGLGCEICRPTVGSILASQANGYILDGDQASLQDTNDHSLANMQRNGTYSVVPRVPGGEITPEQLIGIGEIARDYGLYTKITGGQRIDLFGAKLQELPPIWQRVVDLGMESGHAYGKALRTVKSCVGSTWCRYGVQDSVAMAIGIELRYRGLRAPHKVKMAVSGCTRECAEAQSKDVGVIATENGWNLYVCGNGGKRPRHADLLASDLGDDELIRAIDRFLMFYVRTADRLERTSVWFEKLEGGLDYLRGVVLDDTLGIGPELDADMVRHIESYECEWAATLADPERLENFVEFVNAPEETSTPVWVTERGQKVPQ